jgi:hypothetical protein
LICATSGSAISSTRRAPQDDPSGGRYLAVGSHENAVDIYDTKKPNAEYELVGTCRGHSSFITHLGWSKDGSVLYTNSGDYELLYWYAPKGVQIVNGVDVKDVTWADTTGVLGFETTGVWYRGSDGTDVNSADVSVVHGDHGYQERVLVTGDDRGIVSLFRAPALGGKPKTYGGPLVARRDGEVFQRRLHRLLRRRRRRHGVPVGGDPGGKAGDARGGGGGSQADHRARRGGYQLSEDALILLCITFVHNAYAAYKLDSTFFLLSNTRIMSLCQCSQKCMGA